MPEFHPTAGVEEPRRCPAHDILCRLGVYYQPLYLSNGCNWVFEVGVVRELIGSSIADGQK